MCKISRLVYSCQAQGCRDSARLTGLYGNKFNIRSGDRCPEWACHRDVFKQCPRLPGPLAHVHVPIVDWHIPYPCPACSGCWRAPLKLNLVLSRGGDFGRILEWFVVSRLGIEEG